jgi:hypothetical protein
MPQGSVPLKLKIVAGLARSVRVSKPMPWISPRPFERKLNVSSVRRVMTYSGGLADRGCGMSSAFHMLPRRVTDDPEAVTVGLPERSSATGGLNCVSWPP